MNQTRNNIKVSDDPKKGMTRAMEKKTGTGALPLDGVGINEWKALR